MKKTYLAAIMVLISLSLTGCGGGHDHGGGRAPDQIVTQILSDPFYDGDIVQDPIRSAGVFTVTRGMTSNVQSVFAGIDPITGAEYRAFLDFPLTGTGGVPGDAVIVKAILNIVINSIQPQAGTIPIRIELVSFQPPTLIGTDFDRTLQPALTFTTIVPQISSADVGYPVNVDVTLLMQEAQRSGLADFQIRILEDLGFVSPGLVEITDTTGPNRGVLAPLLEVTYQ